MYSAPHSGAPASHSRTELTTAIAGRATRKPTSRTGTRPQCPRFRCTTSGLHRSSNISAGQLERGTHSETEAYSGVGRCEGVFGSTLKDTYMTGDERDRQRRPPLSSLASLASPGRRPSAAAPRASERAAAAAWVWVCRGCGCRAWGREVPFVSEFALVRCPLVVCCAYSAVQRPAVQRRPGHVPGAGRQQANQAGSTRTPQNAPRHARRTYPHVPGCVRGCLLVGTKVTVTGG
jgi:hypothetical protein